MGNYPKAENVAVENKTNDIYLWRLLMCNNFYVSYVSD